MFPEGIALTTCYMLWGSVEALNAAVPFVIVIVTAIQVWLVRRALRHDDR